MFRNFKSILFATNLQENTRPAFDFAVSIATRYQATIVLLHVLENRVPEYVESLVKNMLGDDKWEEVKSRHEADARQALIAKKSTDQLVRTALSRFCDDAGIDDASCGYHSREIVISDGDVIDEVMDKSKEFECDMIIMGTREGLIKEKTISHVVKGVLNRSHIPVIVVPTEAAEN